MSGCTRLRVYLWQLKISALPLRHMFSEFCACALISLARCLSRAENRNYSQSVARSVESRKASKGSAQLVALDLIISVLWFKGYFISWYMKRYWA